MSLKVPSIVKKNLSLLANTKISSLILIFGPVLLILIIGLALGNTGLKDIQANIYFENESTFTDGFMDSLREHSFILTKTDSLGECKSGVTQQDKNLCLELIKLDKHYPFTVNYNGELVPASEFAYSVNLHVDFSEQRTVWGVINQAQSTVSEFNNDLKGSAADEFQYKAREFAAQISSQQSRIENVIGLLSSQKGTLQPLGDRLRQGDESIRAELDNLEQQLGMAESLLEGAGVSTLPVQQALVSVNSIEASLNNLNGDEIAQSIDLTIERIDEVIEQLLITREQLNVGKRDIESFALGDAGQSTDFIPLSYSSASDDFSPEIQNNLAFLDYLFPSFLTLFLVFVSITLATTVVVRERQTNAHIRNVLSKTKDVSFVFSLFITLFFIVLVQSLIIFFLASLFISIPVFQVFYDFIPILLISIAVFVSIGMIIGYTFNSQETALMGAISISLLLMLFSSLINPLETLPPFIRSVVSFTPMIAAENALRKILIFGSSLSKSSLEIIVLSATFMIVFIASTLVYKVRKRTEISQ